MYLYPYYSFSVGLKCSFVDTLWIPMCERNMYKRNKLMRQLREYFVSSFFWGWLEIGIKMQNWRISWNFLTWINMSRILSTIILRESRLTNCFNLINCNWTFCAIQNCVKWFWRSLFVEFFGMWKNIVQECAGFG